MLEKNVAKNKKFTRAESGFLLISEHKNRPLKKIKPSNPKNSAQRKIPEFAGDEDSDFDVEKHMPIKSKKI